MRPRYTPEVAEPAPSISVNTSERIDWFIGRNDPARSKLNPLRPP
jgi:hypothetical protein